MKTMTISMPEKFHFLCSCPQYLHGSGKPTKKKTTCKQCKGLKFPFTPIGGTVRVFSTPYVFDAATTRNCFGTVRLSSSTSCERQRPTILCRENDPYNFLRKSRLLCTDRTKDQKLQQCNKIPTNNVLARPKHPFVNKSTRIFESVSPSEFHYNRPAMQTTINPYELISSTLHNNEFSPSASLFDLMRKDKTIANNPGAIILQNRNNACNFNISDLFPDYKETIKPTSHPPHPPALEFLPLSVKSISKKILNNSELVSATQNGLKKIMKETKSNRIDDPSLLTVRCKRVQFNTLPELTQPTFYEQKIRDLNLSRNKQDDTLTNGQKTQAGVKKNSQRRKPVMRSMSDRRDKGSSDVLTFKDTTALRAKPQHASPHQIFQKSFNCTLRQRPSCPPPTVPENFQDKSVPQRPPRQQNKKSMIRASSDKVTASRIFGLLPVSTISRTKTKIEPFSNTMSPLNKEQKTSITIHNDECLSTVNVNEVKLYHSSVLIKNGTDQDSQKELGENHMGEKSTENHENQLRLGYNTTGIAIVCHNKDNETLNNAAALEMISTNLNKTKTLISLDYANNSKENNPFDPTTEYNVDDSGYDDDKSIADSFILKLLNDPCLSHLLYGLEIKSIAAIIESSLIQLRTSKYNLITRSTKDTDTDSLFVKCLHEIIKEERSRYDHVMKAKLNDTQLCEKNAMIPVRKLYEMLADPGLWKNGECLPKSDMPSNHQYESICFNCDPIYEEIHEKPPPLPTNPPPILNSAASMFLGATKYEILSYLVDAKDRILIEEPYTFKFLRRSTDESKLHSSHNDTDKCVTSIERNDSGVGSETSKTSRTKYQPSILENKKIQPIHLCEDCDEQMFGESDEYVCRSCSKKRTERREILWEFIETEKKYTRDLQIIIDEFYRPMLVAGLLTKDQLSAIFLNIEELLENSESFCLKIRDSFDAANDQGDDDLFTVDIGRIILETSSMFSAFETYCVQQATSSLLLASLEKDKELLRIFLRVSQMENTVLRRMNLSSFLMVPVQRVTKYPLLLARLYKVTPSHLGEARERLKEAREKIECHLNRMNREAKDISTKLWRRLSSNPPRSRENDIANIKLRKVAMDCLDWNHGKVHFIIEGKLLITHPTDNNWRKGKTIKLTPVNALLITNELTSDRSIVNFPRYSQTKAAAFMLIREKSGRYTMYREPFYLDRCIVCTESDLAEYFEVHEISSKDSFIFKAENDVRTKQWYNQLQYHTQGTGTWRKRRTALANIMINGMMIRQ